LFTHFGTIGVYATVIRVLIAKFVKNDTYESLQVHQLCQHYEGNNLQQVECRVPFYLII